MLISYMLQYANRNRETQVVTTIKKRMVAQTSMDRKKTDSRYI